MPSKSLDVLAQVAPQLATSLLADTYAKGIVVTSRDRALVGKTTGTTTRCQLEGCRGTRVWVRWEDGRLSKPCDRGLTRESDGSLHID